jgi:hypothetical protein
MMDGSRLRADKDVPGALSSACGKTSGPPASFKSFGDLISF